MITYGYIWENKFWEAQYNGHVQAMRVQGQLGESVVLYAVNSSGAITMFNAKTADMIVVTSENKDEYAEYMI
jgi:hypothetical protein